MKILHLSDLHYGKSLHGVSLVESGDQKEWTDRLLEYVRRSKPDAVVIAGDVYDRSIPAKEAIPLLNRLLSGISREGVPVYLIAGNHDGAERLEFLSDILADHNIHIAGRVRSDMVHITQDPHDGFGPVTFWLMPYMFPAAVRVALGCKEDEPMDYTEAARVLLDAQDIDFSARNVLIAHQTVLYNGCEPAHAPSETAVGGVGGIDATVFEGFDYVALGHIHGAQPVGGGRIRYAGSPLCYHFSEAGQKKGPAMITLGAKGDMPKIETEVIPPLHPVRPSVKGRLEDIIEQEKLSTARGEYVRVVLTDEWVQPDARETLRSLFESHDCQMLDLCRDPEQRTLRVDAGGQDTAAIEELSLEDMFLQFYMANRPEEPAVVDMKLIRYLADRIGSRGEAGAVELGQQLADFVMKQEEKKA